MSTHIERLRKLGELEPWESGVPGRRQPQRRLFAGSPLRAWLPELIEQAGTDEEVTIGEEVAVFVDQFVNGGKLTAFHRVDPAKHGIWSINTPSLRLFGFALAQNCLVVTHGDLASNTHATEDAPARNPKRLHLWAVRGYCQHFKIPDNSLLRGDQRNVFFIED